MAEVSRRRILQIAAIGTTASLSLGLAGCPSLPGGDLTGTVQLIADALSTIVSKLPSSLISSSQSSSLGTAITQIKSAVTNLISPTQPGSAKTSSAQIFVQRVNDVIDIIASIGGTVLQFALPGTGVIIATALNAVVKLLPDVEVAFGISVPTTASAGVVAAAAPPIPLTSDQARVILQRVT